MTPQDLLLISFWRYLTRLLLSALISFRAHQGVLLSGSVAFHILLSVVPTFLLALVVLSHLVPEEQLLAVLSGYMELLLPGQSEALSRDVAIFLAHREVIGWLGFGVMLIFSSLAFSVLEDAFAVIFNHRRVEHRRHLLVSAVLPYLYLMTIGVGLALITLFIAALGLLESQVANLLGWSLTPGGLKSGILYFFAVAGVILLFALIYFGLPVGRISWRRALAGGIIAGVLWEIMRQSLLWYFATLSLVNVIYGSLASAVVALLSLEVAALILLFGAQIIAEHDRIAEGGDFKTWGDSHPVALSG